MFLDSDLDSAGNKIVVMKKVFCVKNNIILCNYPLLEHTM